MWRQRGECKHCSQVTAWQRDEAETRAEILQHLKVRHDIKEPQNPRDYQISAERQCDFCLMSYIDHCTKCSRDFCVFHAGDIDGLCGGCI